MRKLIACLATIAALAFGATPAYADPAFGPGNQGGGEGNSSPTGPADPRCHPPGQDGDLPGCK